MPVRPGSMISVFIIVALVAIAAQVTLPFTGISIGRLFEVAIFVMALAIIIIMRRLVMDFILVMVIPPV